MTHLSPARASVGIVAVIFASVALAHLYHGIQVSTGLLPWQAAASLHTGLAALVLWLCYKRGALKALLTWRAPLWTFYPSFIVIVGSLLLAWATSVFVPTPRIATPPLPLAFVLWIPLVEELVFRVGFGQAWRAHLGPVWGAWFSAVMFALVHATPTIWNIAEGRIGLPIGPFLLALACEVLFIKSGRLWPAVLLHAACNGTVFIFSVIDSRWLHWLGFLYL